jgi:3-oxoacyl-(acyl-carrier-protein) synthase
MLAEVRSACWGGMPARPGHFPVLQQGQHPVLDQALVEAAVRPEDVGMAYLSSCGDPQHDAMELACIADTFGPPGPLLTSVTHLTGEYGGLGTFRVAAAVATVRQGISPTLDYLRQPIRTDVRFAVQPVAPPPAVVLVHGLAPGGVHTAILIGRLHDASDVAE